MANYVSNGPVSQPAEVKTEMTVYCNGFAWSVVDGFYIPVDADTVVNFNEPFGFFDKEEEV